MVDISRNMLACAADRLAGLSNVRLVHLPAANLVYFAKTHADRGINNVAAFVFHHRPVITVRYVSSSWTLFRNVGLPLSFASWSSSRKSGTSSTARRAQEASSAPKAGLVRQALLAARSAIVAPENLEMSERMW